MIFKLNLNKKLTFDHLKNSWSMNVIKNDCKCILSHLVIFISIKKINKFNTPLQ